MKEYTIVVDNREKKPLPIKDGTILTVQSPTTIVKAAPVTCRIRRVDRHMPTADYALGDESANIYTCATNPHACVVERKHSVRELQANVFDARKRQNFISMLARMRDAWRFPHLIIDTSLPSLFKKTADVPEPACVIDTTLRLCYHHGVVVVPLAATTAASRRHAAEWVCRLLIQAKEPL